MGARHLRKGEAGEADAPQGREAAAGRPGHPRRWAAACLVWVAYIWLHSLVPGPQSSAESGLVVRLFGGIFNFFGVSDHELMTFIVRKCAHFTEYAVLGFLTRRLAGALPSSRHARPRAVLLALAVACVPVIDETIQRFVPGRDGKPQDMLLDLAGALAGAIISTLWIRWRMRAARSS